MTSQSNDSFVFESPKNTISSFDLNIPNAPMKLNMLTRSSMNMPADAIIVSGLDDLEDTASSAHLEKPSNAEISSDQHNVEDTAQSKTVKKNLFARVFGCLKHVYWF